MDYVTDYAYSDERIIENRTFFWEQCIKPDKKLTKNSQKSHSHLQGQNNSYYQDLGQYNGLRLYN